MQAVVLIPALLAFYVARTRGPAAAFLDVYVPVLLFLPDYFRWFLPGLPDPTLNEAAILPIAALALPALLRSWKRSAIDGLVLGYVLMVAYTEYRSKGWAEAQNLMFDVGSSMLLPYLLAKGLVEPRGNRVAFARRIVLVLAAVTVVSLFESKMGRVPIRMVLDPFFPGQGGWVTTFRYGLARVAGPYGHAILAGVVLVSGYRIQRWLEWSGGWGARRAPFGIPMSFARLMTWVLLLGVVITLVRGPWLGGLAGGAIVLLCRAKNRRAVGAGLLAFLVVVGIPAGIAFYSWASVGRAHATSVSQETAAYRMELVEKYLEVAVQHAAFGWGRSGWPKIAGLESTDNDFLLVALNHGLIAMGLFLALFLVPGIRLVRFGLRRPRSDPAALLAFSFAGILVAFLVSLVTVYHGMQTVQLFFIVLGWSDGLLQEAPRDAGDARAVEAGPARPFRFARVVS